MPGVFESIGSAFSNKAFPAIASGATAGLGELGNLLAGRQQSQQASALQSQEKAISELTPSQLSSMVSGATAPLNAGLVQSVGNTVQGDLAQRGLAQAPGIFAASESQALAPFEQQNQSTAMQLIMQKLGLPLEYAETLARFLPKGQSMTPAMTLFLQQLARLKQSNANGPSPLPMSSPGASDPSVILNPGAAPQFGDPGALDLSQLGVGAAA